MSERSPAIRALVMSRVSCGVCFACGVVNAVLITYLVSTGMYTLSATQVAWLLVLPMVLMVMATGCLFALLRVTRRTAQEEPSESAQRPEHRLAPGLRKPVSLSAANGVTTLEAVLQSIPSSMTSAKRTSERLSGLGAACQWRPMSQCFVWTTQETRSM